MCGGNNKWDGTFTIIPWSSVVIQFSYTLELAFFLFVVDLCHIPRPTNAYDPSFDKSLGRKGIEEVSVEKAAVA